MINFCKKKDKDIFSLWERNFDYIYRNRILFHFFDRSIMIHFWKQVFALCFCPWATCLRILCQCFFIFKWNDSDRIRDRKVFGCFGILVGCLYPFLSFIFSDRLYPFSLILGSRFLRGKNQFLGGFGRSFR